MNSNQKPETKRPLFIRALIIAAIAIGLFAILHPARNRVRMEHQSKQTLLVIQEALQNFHVEDEAYPKKSPMTGAELIQFLVDAKHLESPPLNPATLRPYVLDSNQADRIVYTTDELAETYSLRILELNSDDTLFIVDSTEHHSLE